MPPFRDVFTHILAIIIANMYYINLIPKRYPLYIDLDFLKSSSIYTFSKSGRLYKLLYKGPALLILRLDSF